MKNGLLVLMVVLLVLAGCSKSPKSSDECVLFGLQKTEGSFGDYKAVTMYTRKLEEYCEKVYPDPSKSE